MIGEPEMTDAAAGERPGELLGDGDDRATGTRGPRRTRPWLWGVGGIAAASAVWAAVLHGSGGAAPDLHGYHLGGNPCDGASLSALMDALDVEGFTASDATLSRGPVLDKVACVAAISEPSGDGWLTDYTISVNVELHKRTDPRAEFENPGHARVLTVPARTRTGSTLIAIASSGADSGSADEVHPVTGVGDEAYFLEPHTSDQALVVLNGGAVLSLHVSGHSRWDNPNEEPDETSSPPTAPDLTALHPAMTTAMRGLMASLAS